MGFLYFYKLTNGSFLFKLFAAKRRFLFIWIVVCDNILNNIGDLKRVQISITQCGGLTISA